MPETIEKQLKDLKLRIKTWESEFAKSNQRKPGKEDIHLASSEIKDTYKLYWTLKNRNVTEKACKDDVWSEKFNKPHKENIKTTPSCETLKKLCNKIRERSSITGQNGAIDSPKNQIKSKPPNTETFLNKFCGKNYSDASLNCSISDFDNLESEMQMIKPNAKILKFNDISKKVKAVSVLSSSINLKNLQNKISFETKIDSNWLDRCYEYTSNTSCSNLNAPSTVSGTDQHIACKSDFEHGEYQTDNEKQFPDDHNSTYDKKHLLANSSKSAFTEQLPITQKNSHSFILSQDDKTQSSVSHLMATELMNTQNVSENQIAVELSYFSEADLNISQTQSNVTTSRTQADITTSQDLNISQTQTDLNTSRTEADINTVVDDEEKLEIQQLSQSKKRKLTKDPVSRKATSHLERKIAAGTLNENFVRVNIKKKKFSRGHRTVNIKKLKWKKWKNLKNSGRGEVNLSSPSACFKCGQIGHWARNCNLHMKNEQVPETNEDIDDAPLPTLEEAAELAKKSKTNLLKVKAIKKFESENYEPDILQNLCLDVEMERGDFNEENRSSENVRPLYEFAVEGKPNETPREVFKALNEMGYKSFRKGQETAVMRILSGLSTLVVLPTGSGKSLCYQLPAYIYAKKFKCVTLVISPLVSLMEDQVIGLPSCLHAVCLHSGMTDVQRKVSLQDLENGSAQILLVSPETVISGLSYGFSLPPIAFACIDEAHCLSQWSHNFRPSYLQLYKVLTQRMNVKCILGLTATANLSTAKEITSHLGLQSIEESVVGSTGIPSNLYLSVSRDKDKDRALIQLLSGDRFSNCSSIIIYCIRRDETERLAALIRTCLQDHTFTDEPPTKKHKSKSKKRNFLWTAEAYHAGLAPPRRRSIQKQFMSGKLRVVVATIAFGMGLDKRDVRAVIHYNMPKSFESYVQEIGRAGRDGHDAHCHLFLENEGKDMQELRRHIYSNSSDRHIIRKLLRKVFVPCKCNIPDEVANMEIQDSFQSQSKCPKHEIAFSISDSVQELDLKEENILTFLCYLELHPKQWIEVLPPTYITCTIRCYGGPKQLRDLASKSAPVAAAFAIDTMKGRSLGNVSTYEFAVIEVAAFMGWNSGSVKRELKNLEWNEQKRKTGVIVGFSDLAFHINSPGNLSDDQLDGVLDFLHEKVINSEKSELYNLKSLFSIFSKYSHAHYWACTDVAPIEFSEGIKEAINKYFEETENSIDVDDSQTEIENNTEVDVLYTRSQIRDIIYTNNDQNFTGRAIARIFHGIGSPRYPAEVWGKVRKFWRCSLHVDFNLLIKLANEELKKSK